MAILRGRRTLSGHPILLTPPAPPVQATSYTMTQSATTGAVNVGDTLTFAPVGGVWPTAGITIAASSVTHTLTGISGGSVSGSVLTVPASTTTSCTVSLVFTAAGASVISATNSGTMTNPGTLNYTATSGSTGGTLPAFTLTNWGGSASAPFARVGMAFAKGDVPAGSTPTVASGPALQFDARAVWSDGSLRFAVAHVRDATSFAAGASRSFTLTSVSGAFNNAGSLTLASVLSGHDFKVNFSNVKQYNTAPQAVTRTAGTASDTLPSTPISSEVFITNYTQGVDFSISGATITWTGSHKPPDNSGYYPVYLTGSFSNTVRGSGAFTSSLTTAIATATRITKIHSGPVCEGWMIWNMATDNTGGAADAHLKTYWYVDCWKNSDGSVYAIEVAAVVAQDWWSVANKFRVHYNATLADGSTTINTYSGVQHPYGSWWITCLTASDNNIGRRPWTVGAIPTLVYKPDRTYLIKTGLIPPLDLTVTATPISSSLLVYTPCQAGPTGIDGNEQGVYHRVSIDGTGAYLGRGNLPRQDTNAIMLQTPLDMANARIGALGGLSVPSHRRSNRTRTRPGESTADTASTIIAQKLDNPNKSAGWDDCTADGMPAPVYAYAGDGRNASPWTDSYVRAGGGELCDPYIQAGVWSVVTTDSSHAVAYSYGMYVLEGEDYFREATLDHACWCLYQTLANGYAVRGLLLAGDTAYSALSIPSVSYSALPDLYQGANQRATGWAVNLIGMAAGIIGQDHVAYNYMQKWLGSVGDWIGASLQYMPASQKAYGAFYPSSGISSGTAQASDIPPWFLGIIALGSYQAFRMTEDTRYRALGDCAVNLPIGIYASGRNYIADQYHVADRPHADVWSTSNEFFAPGNSPAHNFGGSVTDHASGLLSFDIGEGGGQNQSGGSVTMTSGDQWSPSNSVVGVQYSGTIPPEITEGTIYYVRDVTVSTVFGMPNSATFRIAASSGGAAITFAVNSGTFGMSWWPQDAVHAVCTNPPYIIPADSFGPMNAAAVEMAKACGNAAATTTIVNNMRTFIAPVDRAGWTPWALKAS